MKYDTMPTAQCNVCRQPVLYKGPGKFKCGCDNGPGSGKKYDGGKRRYDLVPAYAFGKYVDAITYGAKKYSDDNWMRVEPYDHRYYGAAMRHIQAWRAGESIDPESGLLHLASAVSCLMFIIEKERKHGKV